MKFSMQTATTNACNASVDTLQVLQDLDKMVAGHLALADKKRGTAGQVLVFCNCFVERLGRTLKSVWKSLYRLASNSLFDISMCDGWVSSHGRAQFKVYATWHLLAVHSPGGPLLDGRGGHCSGRLRGANVPWFLLH